MAHQKVRSHARVILLVILCTAMHARASTILGNVQIAFDVDQDPATGCSTQMGAHALKGIDLVVHAQMHPTAATPPRFISCIDQRLQDTSFISGASSFRRAPSRSSSDVLEMAFSRAILAIGANVSLFAFSSAGSSGEWRALMPGPDGRVLPPIQFEVNTKLPGSKAISWISVCLIILGVFFIALRRRRHSTLMAIVMLASIGPMDIPAQIRVGDRHLSWDSMKPLARDPLVCAASPVWPTIQSLFVTEVEHVLVLRLEFCPANSKRDESKSASAVTMPSAA